MDDRRKSKKSGKPNTTLTFFFLSHAFSPLKGILEGPLLLALKRAHPRNKWNYSLKL